MSTNINGSHLASLSDLPHARQTPSNDISCAELATTTPSITRRSGKAMPQLYAEPSALDAISACQKESPMPAPDPLAIVTFRGKRMDRKTAAALAIAERRLGYELTVTQGGYNAGGVSASAGTHDRGGVVDLTAYDQARKVRVLRDLGFAAWYRPMIPGHWPAHVHAVMIGHQDLAPGAARQVTAYLAGRDGLAGNGVDPNKYRSKADPFNFAAAWRDDLLRQRIKGIKARRKALADKAARLKSQITYRR